MEILRHRPLSFTVSSGSFFVLTGSTWGHETTSNHLCVSMGKKEAASIFNELKYMIRRKAHF